MPDTTNSPLVSILIPLYNAEKYIGDLLEWCIRQPYKNIEVVVVDDHSTDNSFAIAKRYENDRIHVLTNPKKGSQSARNYAFEHSTGQYVKFHDADDYGSDNLILKQVERMLKDGDENAIVFSSLHTLSTNGSLYSLKSYNDKDYDDPIDYLSTAYRSFSFHCPHCFLLNRQTVEKVGGWKEDVMILQDNHFFTKAVEQASKMLYVEGEYAIWRIFNDSQHLHCRTTEKMKNGIHTICDMANTLLRHRDDQKTRQIVSDFIGQYVYRDIRSFYPILPYVDSVCKQNGLEWTKVKSERLGFLYSILGWKYTTLLIDKWKKMGKLFTHLVNRKG